MLYVMFFFYRQRLRSVFLTSKEKKCFEQRLKVSPVLCSLFSGLVGCWIIVVSTVTTITITTTVSYKLQKDKRLFSMHDSNSKNTVGNIMVAGAASSSSFVSKFQ
jgi:hypothetical protein